VAAITFGLAPALKASKVTLSEALNQGGRGGSSGRSKLRGAFVISSVAFGLVATIGAGLFLQSFRNAKHTNIGFDQNNVLLVGLDLSQNRMSQDQGIAFYHRLREEIKSLPSVTSVAYANDVPLGFGGGSWDEISVEGYQPQHGESMKIYRNIVSPGYFGLMKIAMVQGRDFTDADDDKSNVIVVNETFVKRYFGNSIPLGRVVRVWNQPVTIIGVVKDPSLTCTILLLSRTEREWRFTSEPAVIPMRCFRRWNARLKISTQASRSSFQWRWMNTSEPRSTRRNLLPSC
jgi:putative ABC transport system permease protein